MKQTKFPPVKGTRDFYPEQMAFRKWLFGKMRQVSERFGYEEYEGPILEPFDLYAAKSGEELVADQTFVLNDRGGRKLALRPEMTPTLARMVAQKQGELTFPLRWYNIGPRFRYEQPQKGRGREFYQWDVDLLGSPTPEADAEVIAVAAEFLKSLGFTSKEVVIKVNNRRLMDFKLSLINVPPEDRPKIFRAIDKKNKMAPSEWEKYLESLKLGSLQIKDLEKIVTDRDFSGESEDLTATFEDLKNWGVAEFVEFDASVVRGLDYYTGTVFEAQDREGEFRAILGGGRYDNLVETVGGNRVPGVGFAAGDYVLEIVLNKFGKIPEVSPNKTQVLVTVFDSSFLKDSLKIATNLQSLGFNAEVYPRTQVKLDKQLKYANDRRIPFAVIVGPDEVSQNLVTLRDLRKREQKTISHESLSNEIRQS